MGAVLRGTVGLALLAASGGCASPGSDRAPQEPPRFVRFWGVFRPEERHRDVIECADEARQAIGADASFLRGPPEAAGLALRERVVACMKQRGWGPAEGGVPAPADRV
jgi:hypothetical protein